MRRISAFLLIGSISFATPAASVSAGIINVPADQPTIQAAIDAAVNGDEIVVAPGTYAENLSFKGKMITLRSSGGPAVTTLMPDSQGAGPTFLNPGSLAMDTANNHVLVADNGTFTLYDVDLVTGDRTIISDSVTGAGPTIDNNEGVELDTNGNRALAIHRVPNAALYGINLTTGDRNVISGPGVGSGTAFSQIEAVQFDAANNRALIIDSFLQTVFGVNLATGARTVLASPSVGTGPDMQSSRDIVYNPITNTAYVFAHLVFTTTPAIYSVDLNTGNRAILSDPTHGTGTDFLFASGLALNVAGNEVFALDANLRAVFSVDMTTGNRTIVSQNGGPGVGIDFFSPWDIEYDAAADRVLVVDLSLDALISVDLVTGDRSTVSRVSNTQSIKIDQGEAAGTTLQGFTITGAQAAGAVRVSNSSQPTIRDCVFDDNHTSSNGGAISTTNNSVSTILDCLFTNNSAGNAGGAVMTDTSGQMTVTRCRFAGNSANFGGAMLIGGIATVHNCMVTGNEATTSGGGIYLDSFSQSSLLNNTIVGNLLGNGVSDGGFLGGNTITNSIIRGNAPFQTLLNTAVVDHCNVEGGIAGTGNIDAPALFADADGPDNIAGTVDDDFSLLAGSPGIDAGDSDAVAACTLDLAGNDRRVDDPATADTGAGFGAPVDMGACEFASAFFDCNSNGLLDSCEALVFSETSNLLTPIGEGVPQAWTFFGVPQAGVGGVTLIFDATGDFGDPIEYVDVLLNGTPVGTVFLDPAADCPASPERDQLLLPDTTYNPLIGGGNAAITMSPSASVAANPVGCTSSITVRLVYQAVTFDDANGDGFPDACTCSGDVDHDGNVNVVDLLTLLGLWGPCPAVCTSDLNGDGSVSVVDLLDLLGAWGPCP